MTENPPEDFIGAVNAGKAAEAAKQAALAAPPRPPRAKKQAALDSWLDAMVSGIVEDTRNALKGKRETTLNNGALRIGGYIHLGVDRANAERELFAAAEHNGWVSEEGASHVGWKIRRAIEDGMKKPNERPDLDAENTVTITDPQAAPWQPGGTSKPGKKQAAHRNGDQDPEHAKTLKMRRLSTVKSRVPMWVWEYGDKGRIQLGTVTMFAGKPTAGKSTAVRWFAARLSKGELPGVWYGHPMKVAVVMSEEQTDAVVVPGLVAAGADMQNVYTPEIKFGDMESSLKIEDVYQLREELLANEIRAVFIDPIMSMFSGKSDVYRTNEVREALAPFVSIAKDINGIVVGVTHLKKGEIKDVLGGMNGSAAFGEVPRAVFGFAPLDVAGDHVLQQVKNSAGENNLKLTYQLPIQYLTADDGQPIELPRFEITGTTEIGIDDINPDGDETTGIAAAMDWLKMHLLEHQPAPSSQVKVDAKKYGDIGPRMLGRAAKRLGVKIFPRSEPGKPYTTVWTLPEWNGAAHG